MYFDSEWSEANELMNPDSSAENDESNIALIRANEQKNFLNQVLKTWGTLGLVILDRSKRFGFDRKKLFGCRNATMSRFSAGMTLTDIEKELTKAVNSALFTSYGKTNEAFECLKMIDKILPQNLEKLMGLVSAKYLARPGTTSYHSMREVSAVKILVDFRVSLYKFTGNHSKLFKYLQAGNEIFKCLN